MTRRRRLAVRICSVQKAVRVPRRRIVELVSFVACAEKASLGEVDLAVVDRKRITELNLRYLGRDAATDVLSFDLSDPPYGSVNAQLVVCGPVAVEQARRRGCGPQRELMLYVVHGLLHLMGYDDNSAGAAARMQARQEELLEQFLARASRKA